MISVIANRYAHALVDVVTAPGSGLDTKTVGDQLGEVAGTILASHQLRAVLMSPAVPKAKKKAVIGRVADAMGLPKKLKNFLFITVDASANWPKSAKRSISHSTTGWDSCAPTLLRPKN
jgi:F0F1-type ATP synthase delta subunit